MNIYLADDSTFDYDDPPAGAGLDIWDSIDDSNNTGTFPTDNRSPQLARTYP